MMYTKADMKRIIFAFAPMMCVIVPLLGKSADVESFYHENIASRKTGVYEVDGMVYFHTSSVRVAGTDDSVCRRKALLDVRKMMFEWIAKHAPPYETLPESIRKIDSLCARYGGEAVAGAANIRVSGRGFTDEADEKYIYGLAVPVEQLLREAEKGTPGKTEGDIVARWKVICTRELNQPNAHQFLSKIGCGDVNTVPKGFAEKISAECAFLDGWDLSSQIVGMLKTTGRDNQEPEDLWMEGLSLIADLKDGKVKLADSGLRLHGALLETPGSPILWCYLGNYLKDRRLYRLSAIAYKNAFCLSANIGILPLLKSSVGNLAHIYRALHCDAKAEGFDLLAIGIRK